jgi:hypothetical protein
MLSSILTAMHPSKIVEALLDGGDDPKDYAYDRVDLPQGTFTVTSSHGQLEADLATGSVLKVDRYDEDDPDSQFIDEIDRFDMKEYRQWCRKTGLEDGTGCDILFIGFWSKDGSYENAEEDARQDYVNDRGPEPPEQ